MKAEPKRSYAFYIVILAMACMAIAVQSDAIRDAIIDTMFNRGVRLGMVAVIPLTAGIVLLKNRR